MRKTFVQFAQRGVWGGWKPHKYWVFPHYTWGYIGLFTDNGRRTPVPSLYVRVYRHTMAVKFYDERSLTIREGISRRSKRVLSKSQFPHYTWGYIVVKNHECKSHHVPSLYVRVYRIYNSILTHKTRSLTIREGISNPNPRKLLLLPFPHYMWVYIEIGNGILQASKNINVVDDSIPQIA